MFGTPTTKAIEAFQEWDRRDLDFVRRHAQHAQKGQSLLIPDSPRKAAGATESDAQEQVANPSAVTQDLTIQQAPPIKKPKSISLQLMHKRLGHRATKSILLAENANLYSDIKIIPDQDPFCTTCKLSTIRAQDRGPVAEARHDTKPGQILYLDAQPNMAKQALTKRDYYHDYLNVVDAKSRLFRLIGLHATATKDVTQALEEWAVENKPFTGYALTEHCEEIHVDAGPQLVSEEFQNWCVERRIKLVIAAPHHQEMNGMCERMWQAARKIAFALCTGARLGWAFYHHALMYATRIMDFLPIKGCMRIQDNVLQQSCPDAVHHDTNQSKVGKLRVFGCPVVAKVYKRKTILQDDRPRTNLDSRNIIQ